MSSVIRSAIATVAVAAAERSGTSASARPQPRTPTPNASTDVVQLSEAQRVFQLYGQGQTVSQIASDLGLSVAAVAGYLELPTAA